MATDFVDPLDQFVIKNILIVSDDEVTVGRISLFAAQVKGSHSGQRIETATVDTLRKARAYIKNNHINILFLDPAVDTARSVLNFVKDIRTAFKRIVWVVFGSKVWWEQNKKLIQGHAWGKRFSKYYWLSKKDLSGDDAYKNFVFALTSCHWDFVLQLLSDAADHIISEDVGRTMTPDQVKKFIEKGMAPLQSLSRHQGKRTGDAFVSMMQSGAYPAQYTVAIQQPLKAANYNSFFAGDARMDGQVPEEIFSKIRNCSLFVADLTELRHSVLIEIGYAMALGVPRILVRHHDLKDKDLPFLIQGVQIPTYVNVESLKDLVGRELERLNKN
jgi:hypothetical protein